MKATCHARPTPPCGDTTGGLPTRARSMGGFWLAYGTIVILSCCLVSEAAAQVYHYRDPTGMDVFTTYRRGDLELIEVIGGEAASSSPTRSQSSGSGRASSPRRSYDHDAYDEIIREASDAYDLPFEFIKAVIRAESAFNPRAVSRVGAQGLMQLMPGTAEGLGVEDSFDPRQNIFGGTLYLRQLTDRFGGDINLVLSGYNAGPGAVAQHEGIPYAATRRYIQTVYRYYREYREQSN